MNNIFSWILSPEIREYLRGNYRPKRFQPIDLSRRDVAFGDSGYRVVDWLHRISVKELPAGQEILREIGARLWRINCPKWVEAKNQFLHIFARNQSKVCYMPYHVWQTALSDLVEKYCQNHSQLTFTD